MSENSSPNLRDVIKKEYFKCSQDPVYFMRNYVKVQHQTRGIVFFDLYPFQEKTLKDFHDYERNIILKSRQMGISTLISAYSLWIMIFKPGKNILVVSIKQDASKEIISKVKLANDHLPSWMKVEAVEENRLSLKFKNESRIMATTSAESATRGSSAFLVIMDEAAFIDEAFEIWTSAQQTMATGGSAIILSTPNGVGNFFHKTWVDAENKKNKFHTIKIPWHLHPERDQAWRNNQTIELGERMASQECDASFLTSGTNVVDLKVIEWYEQNFQRDPIELRGDQSLWIFDRVNSSKDYIVSADVARGDGSDYSAAHVLDLDTMEQVAEYQNKIDTKEFGNLLVSLATEYNDALLIIENANIGHAVLQQVIDRRYKNTFYQSLDLKIADVWHQFTTKYYREEQKMRPGFTTTLNTRPLIISKIDQYFREKSVIIRSCRTLNELKTFIYEKGKAQAAIGYNDDLIMSLGIGLWIKDTALRLRSEGTLLTRNMLSSISFPKPADNIPIYVATKTGNGQDYWRMRTGTGKPDSFVDLKWLL